MVTVEFALTAPLLFLLVMGSIEFSRANMLLHSTTVAATEAVRKGIIPGASAAEIESTAREELMFAGIAEADVLVSPQVITADTKLVTVGVSVPIDGRNGYVLPQFFVGKKIQKVVSLPREATRDENTSQAIADANAQMRQQLDQIPANNSNSANSASANNSANAMASGSGGGSGNCGPGQ